jgi:hypothetical protein
MTAKTKSERLRRLLSHGYFAPELPPCFVSEGLAKYRASILAGIDALPNVRGKPAFHRFSSEPSWFYFPRFGKDDRKHGVPNPISYLLLARAVADNYVKIRQVAKSSKISASPPIFDWHGLRALIRPSIDLRDDFRVDLSSRRETYVAADIRAFFHSIYTHAIPWALHGKDFAKVHRGTEHYGNLIDLLCRNAQDGQTIGLPVGPDCSRLIAEVIASGIDLELSKSIGTSPRDASRYIDDYTISGQGNVSGEGLIAALRQAAAVFELELNNEKSAAFSTSTRTDGGWKHEVRSYVPRDMMDDSQFQLFLYRVGRICEAHPAINVEKYALQNARAAIIRAEGWKKIQSHLIAAYRRNASLIQLLVEIMILRQAERGDIHRAPLNEFLAHRLPSLAEKNRTGEIIWLLFLAIRLGILQQASSLVPLFELDNSMIALLVAVCVDRGLVKGKVDFSGWNRTLNSDGLRSGMWLFAYESVGLGINPDDSTAFIEEDEYFSLLFRRDIRFLSLENGFTSIESTLRSLRDENTRLRRIRDDFAEDFEIDTEELDDEDDKSGGDRKEKDEVEDVGY